MIQLELTFGCQKPIESINSNYSIGVTFSTDGGINWIELNYGQQVWVHHVSEFLNWKRISLKLPTDSWSDSTRFRVIWKGIPPLENDKSIKGALAYFYVGPECSEMCRGNGQCSISGCVCDEGFWRESCVPESETRTNSLSSESISITGGAKITEDTDGCFVRGVWNALMDSAGVRVLETTEFEYSPESSVQFFLRIGECGIENSSGEDHSSVQLQFSWNGGSDWILIREFRRPFFPIPYFQRIPISPPDAELYQNYIKIRLVQNNIQQRDKNIWSVAGLSIWNPTMALTKSDIHQMKHVQQENNEELWLVKNVADPRKSCHLFDIHCQKRVQWYGAMTKDLILQKDDSIQFGMVTGVQKTKRHSWVALEYSVDGGAEWQWVQSNCIYPWMNCKEIQQYSKMNYEILSDQEERYHYSVTEDMANR